MGISDVDWHKYTISQTFLIIFFTLVLLFLILAGGNWLWCYFAPMFNLPLLSYWQFVGLWILVSLFIKR
jgi:hypothetical protein